MISVARIGRVFVKATRFLRPNSVEVDHCGIRHDRAFALLEADGSFVASDRHGDFFPLTFQFDPAEDSLRMETPEGRVLEGSAKVTGGGRWEYNLHGIRRLPIAEVGGPFTQAISDFAGRPIRLVRCLDRVSAVDVMPVTFVTTGSLRRLGRELGVQVDADRFRPGFVFDNEVEHEEDGWDGRLIRIGSVTLRVRTPVPRCSIPGLNPQRGLRDLEVMKGLIRYRDRQAYPDGLLAGHATPGFATYAEVVETGSVRVGDRVEMLG